MTLRIIRPAVQRFGMAALAAAALAMAWQWGAHTGGTAGLAVEYSTRNVNRGPIRPSVTASGELKPLNLVSVGTQVSGKIEKIYVDFNDVVKKDQLLATVDASLLKAQIAQSEAQLTNNIAATKLAELNAARSKRLYDAGYIARADWERADQDARSARTNTEISKAQLERDRVNLSYAEVRSPVDGIVIAKLVNEGQTVQASFQTPELFKIAEDLTKMQIDINLSEMDIGRVHEGQKAEFRVDAYPGETFTGTVSKVHISPNNQQGIVTYNVLVAFDNAEKKLLPGMTAYVRIITDEKPDVLRVPNAALRYAPAGASFAQGKHHVYTLQGGRPSLVEVTTGIGDNDYTEITGSALKEGDAVVVQEIARVNE